MFRLLAVTLFFFSANACNILRPSGLSGGGSCDDECKQALSPTYTEQQLDKAAVETCIAEQPGLQDTIDSLTSSFSFRALAPSDRLFGRKPTKDVAALLEENSYATEATTLRTCVARERGMLNDDGTYNMGALKDSITSKMTGLDIATNTQLGLDGCPDVVEFDVAEYMTCITTYCTTGAAP